MFKSIRRMASVATLAALALNMHAQEEQEMPEYAITPADGMELYEIDHIEISFGTQSVEIADAEMIFLETAAGDAIDFVADATEFGPELALIVKPLTSITEPGEYKLIVGYGALKVAGELLPQPIVASWTVLPAAETWDGEILIDPADGSNLDCFHSVLLTFVGATVVKVDETAGPEAFPTLVNTADNSVEKAMVFADDNTLEIIIFSYLETPGEYLLTVSKELLKIDGAPLAENISLRYTIGGSSASWDYTYSFDPADGSIIGCQDTITVTFAAEGLQKVECNPYASELDGTLPRLYDTNGKGVACAISYGADNMSFSLTPFYPIEEAGEYTLKVPAGYATLYNADGQQMKNAAFSATYTVTTTGLDAITGATTNLEIYNLDGTPARLPLDNGIYIINRKTTLIRK